MAEIPLKHEHSTQYLMYHTPFYRDRSIELMEMFVLNLGGGRKALADFRRAVK
ncbi:MAG: hypothetical protein RR893_02520 [Clostridia bacterium]